MQKQRWDLLIQQIKGLPVWLLWRATVILGREAGWSEKSWRICRGVERQAGAADYSGNCQLQSLQSGSNRFRMGEEEVTVDFCQGSLCLCLPAECNDIRKAMVEMSHNLILALIIQQCMCSLWS
uniref:Uncharacterized protein n=1 Tax=Knipowitschia caucasica TaxID=637954 RepID=A0AAV2L3R6_KNICA